MNLEHILADTMEMARAAGEILRENFHKPHQTRHKGPVDLVTETDLAIEAFAKKQLKRVLPEAAFVGEESSAPQDAKTGLCWVVDPVDGTTNFVHRIPMVCVSIALCQNGRPLLGIVNAPVLGECFHAVKDGGAFLNGNCLQVSAETDIRQSLVATGFPYEMEGVLDGIMARLRRVLPATQGLRRPGSAAIDLAWLAAGRIDAFFEAGLKPWDMAAGWLLVEEAGGKVTDFDGAPEEFGKNVLASNGHVHTAMVALLAEQLPATRRWP